MFVGLAAAIQNKEIAYPQSEITEELLSFEYEYTRQVEEWLETGKVMSAGAKSTRGWDDGRMVTFLQREKEDAHDYRYFPDPDLVPLKIDDAWVDEVRKQLPELPAARETRYRDELGLSEVDARAIIDDVALCAFFEQVLATGADAKRAAAVLRNYGAKRANDQGVQVHELGVTPQQIKDIIALVDADKISSSAADKLFGLCCESDVSAEALAEKHGLLQVSDTGALEGFVDQVLADAKNAQIVDDIKGGKDKAIGALMGQIMKLSKGQANPKLVTDLIRKKLLG